MSDRQEHKLDVLCMTAIGGRKDIMAALLALPAMQKRIDQCGNHKSRPGSALAINTIEFNKVYM